MRGAALALALTGCATTSPPPDAVAQDAPSDLARDTFDVVTQDAPRDATIDAPRDAAIDTAPDAAQDVDLRPYDPCAPSLLRDLNALGTRDGGATTVLGDNLSVSRLGPLGSPCAGSMTGHQVTYRYTPRATTRLRISTNDARTDARLDTVVFALTSCRPVGDGGAHAIGCSDDSGDPPRDHATTFVTDEDVTAGAPVYIVVAGFLHATRELFDSQGHFALTVTEQ